MRSYVDYLVPNLDKPCSDILLGLQTGLKNILSTPMKNNNRKKKLVDEYCIRTQDFEKNFCKPCRDKINCALNTCTTIHTKCSG